MLLQIVLFNFYVNAKVTLQGTEKNGILFSCISWCSELPSKDRNKNRCVVSFRSESEILIEKTCDIRLGDKAEFFIGDLPGAESLIIDEVKTFSEFLSTIDFQSPVKWEGGENSGNLQDLAFQNLSNFYNFRDLWRSRWRFGSQKELLLFLTTTRTTKICTMLI